MIIIKSVILFTIFIGSCKIGFLLSQKYKDRVLELKEFKDAINILETKIKFTYEPIGEIFTQIAKMKEDKKVVSNIFTKTCTNMKNADVKVAWESAIDNSKSNLNLTKEDINILKGFGKLLR